MTQSPAHQSVRLGETASLSCTASSGVDDDLSWYLVKPGQAPQLLFYKINTRESGTPSRFSSTGSEPEFTLSISGVQTEDTGDYYCMGAYSGGIRTQWFRAGQKPPTQSGYRRTLLRRKRLWHRSVRTRLTATSPSTDIQSLKQVFLFVMFICSFIQMLWTHPLLKTENISRDRLDVTPSSRLTGWQMTWASNECVILTVQCNFAES